VFIKDIGHTDIPAGTKYHTQPASFAAMCIECNISHLTALSDTKCINGDASTPILNGYAASDAVVSLIITLAQAIARKNRSQVRAKKDLLYAVTA